MRENVPASVDSFVWLALYLSERPLIEPGGPVWWTRRWQPVPQNYQAMRAVLRRANASLGANWSLHDFRRRADAGRSRVHVGRRADRVAPCQRDDDSDLHSAAPGRSDRQGLGAPRPAEDRRGDDRTRLRRRGGSGTVRAADLSAEDTRSPARRQAATGLQSLTADELWGVVAEHHRALTCKQHQPIVRGTQAVLGVLARYPGQTWEQRWLASGYGAAPRTWFEHDAFPHYDHLPSSASSRRRTERGSARSPRWKTA